MEESIFIGSGTPNLFLVMVFYALLAFGAWYVNK